MITASRTRACSPHERPPENDGEVVSQDGRGVARELHTSILTGYGRYRFGSGGWYDGEMDWKSHGIRIVRAGELDSNTPQTPGMTRAAAITHATAGAQKLWAGTVVVQPDAKTGAHHHGELETVLYIVKGRARFRWGEKLEFVDEAGPGDFIYVPPYVPHQEINARRDEPVEAVVVRSGQEPVVVNLDIESPEPRSDAADRFHPPR
jgi:uncharacterized RmlC-like cupin family protein